MTITEEARDAFLTELTALTQKHGIVIWGCGCCSSPLLKPLEEKNAGGEYEATGINHDPNGDVAWSKDD